MPRLRHCRAAIRLSGVDEKVMVSTSLLLGLFDGRAQLLFSAKTVPTRIPKDQASPVSATICTVIEQKASSNVLASWPRECLIEYKRQDTRLIVVSRGDLERRLRTPRRDSPKDTARVRCSSHFRKWRPIHLRDPFTRLVRALLSVAMLSLHLRIIYRLLTCILVETLLRNDVIRSSPLSCEVLD